MTMKGRETPWYLVVLVIALVALPVLVSVCWPIQASRPADPTATAASVFAMPTPEPTTTAVIAGPPTPHLTMTPRLPATPTAYVVVGTPIPPLPTPTATTDVMPLEVPTMRPMPTGGVPPVQAPRR